MSSIHSDIIFLMLAELRTALLYCSVSATCSSVFAARSGAVFAPVMLGTAPGKIGSVHAWPVSRKYFALDSSSPESPCAPPPIVLGMAARFSVHSSNKRMRES